MKKWEVQSKLQIVNSKLQKENFRKLIKVLLANRGIKTKKETEEFLNPKLSDLDINSLGISKKDLQKCLSRIKKAIERKEQVIVFGDLKDHESTVSHLSKDERGYRIFNEDINTQPAITYLKKVTWDKA